MTDNISTINDSVAKKIAAIQAEIERKNQEAQSLLGYLTEQQNAAKLEEELEEENLKKQGIIVGQHIPSLPSRLNLDQYQLSQYDTFSTTLLVAKDLIDQNRTDFLRRTGNLPISEAAEAKREANQKYLAMQDPEKPHYLLETSNSKVREERVTVRFAETINEVHKTTKKTIKDDASITSSKKSAKENKAIITTKERLEHEAVIKGLQHKMNYMRNPRNNPNSVTKMLVKPKDFYSKSVDGGLNEAGNGGDLNEGGSYKGGSAGSVGEGSVVGQSAGEHDDQSSLSSRLKAKYSKYIKLDNNPLFVCDPKIVSFIDFEIGEKYSKNISFTNISAVSRTVRILPPKSKLFGISPLRYPANCANGVIAPGMSVSCTLTFTPETLGDFEEYITVNTEAGNTSVKIIAQREPPNLDLPTDINLGYTLVGDAQRSVILVTNTGGFGNFKVIENMDIDECDNYDLNTLNPHCLRIPPFTVYPSEFALAKGQSIELNFEFLPLTLGKLNRTYQIQCDNGTVKNYQVIATSKEIHLSTVELNNVHFNDQDTMIYRDLYFNNVTSGSEMVQKISVVNDTGISVEYEWVWVDTSLPYKDWNHIGQDLIVKREKNQRPLTVLDTDEDGIHLDGDQNPHDAEVDHNILRSLKETFQHGDDGTKGNSNKEGPFEILPARGVLAGEGAAEFKIVYNPTCKDSTSLRAIMMIKSIPFASMPNREQENYLNDLLNNGHGKYPRLSSWLEEIGVFGEVNEYRKINGYPSKEKKLIPLQSIIQLIYSQIPELQENPENSIPNDSDDEKYKEKNYLLKNIELPRVNRWLRNIIQHVYGIRKRDALGSALDDNSSLVAFSTVTSAGHQYNDQGEKLFEVVELYDWTKNSLNSDHPSLPLFVPPLVLKYEEKDVNEEDELDPPDEDSIIEKIDNGFDLELKQLLISKDAGMLTEIFIDRSTALVILGDYLSSLVDIQVSHEAVTFLKEYNLTNLSSISFLVHGKSNATKLILSPPKLLLNAAYTLGYEFDASITLVNPNDSSLQLSIDLRNVILKRLLYSTSLTSHLLDETNHEEIDKQLLSLAALIPRNPTSFSNPSVARPPQPPHINSNPELAADLENNENNDNLDIICSHDNILLLPHSSEVITFKLKIFKLGLFEILVPIKSINDTSSHLEIVTIQANVVGPKIRFDTAEVDIGLLGVGGENNYTLSFSNESDVPLMFMMKPTIHVDNMIAGKKGSENISGNNNNNNSSGAMLSARDSARSENIPESARSARSARSTHSNISRASSMRSEDFSIADSQATPGGDFKIELKNAIINVEPSNGIIEPHSSLTVSVVSKAGKTPQRVRGMIESRIFDIQGKNEISKQYLNLRGEIQSPKVLCYPQFHNLGQVYVGRTVTFEFFLENICNLPTKFKFLRPGGSSTFFNFTLDPLKGSLNAKEKLTIRGTFTSLTTGLIDDLLSCKLFGISTPLGINLKALSKGISLEFINLKENDPIPQPIAAEDDPQFPNANEKPPEPRPIEPIFLGNDVPLYERRNCKFVIRNLSAIPAPFEIKPKKFMVIEKKKRFGTGTANSQVGSAIGGSSVAGSIAGGGGVGGGSVATGSRKDSKHSVSTASIQSVQSSTTSIGFVERKDLLIGPHEHGTHKFNSEQGKKYIAFELNRREDRKFLKSGLGASYLVDVTSGILPPWGVQEVHVHAFNDIPGCYDDDIEVSIRENEIIRKFNLPIKMTVIGCPIVIEKHTMGMTSASDPIFLNIIKKNEEKKAEALAKALEEGRPAPASASAFGLTPQLLQLGEVCEHGNVLKRHFIVRNYGSKDAKVKWQVRGLAANANGPIKISLNYVDPSIYSGLSPKKLKQQNVNVNHRLKTSIRFWDDIAKESPFQIEPKKSTIAPYDKQIFTVTLLNNSPERNDKALLTANIVIEDSEETKKTQAAAAQQLNDTSRILNNPNDGLPEVTRSQELILPNDLLDNSYDEADQPPPSESKPQPEDSHPPKIDGSQLHQSSVHSIVSHPSTHSGISSKDNEKQQFHLELFVEGSYIHPKIEIDKHTHTIPYQNTIVPDQEAVHLKAKSTLLFTSNFNGSNSVMQQGSMSMANNSIASASIYQMNAMQTNPICTKLITVTNPLDIEVVIHVATEGALLIKDYEEVNPEGGSKGNKKVKNPLTSIQETSSSPQKDDGHSGKKIKFQDDQQTSPTSSPNRDSIVKSSVVSVKSQKNPNKEGKVLKLIPHQTTKFMIMFNPKKHLREQLMSTFGKEYGKPTDQKSFLIFTYPTGQSLRLPVITSISTPFITGSSPRLFFGTCHVQRTCQGVFLLSNPTDVPARWNISHVPGGGQWKQSTAIRVKGFEKVPEVDDPTVFTISPMNGIVEGPTVSVAATMSAPPKDYNRKENTIVPERLVQSSWVTNTLSINDTLTLRHQNNFTLTNGGGGNGSMKIQGTIIPLGETAGGGGNPSADNDIHYPMPITIIFSPKQNQKYCSRFRFSCEFANTFDLVLQGDGTYEEHEHQPLNPLPRG